MNPVIYLCCFLPIIIALILQLKNNNEFIKRKIKRKHNKENRLAMNEMIKNYIGKECLIYTMNSQITGVIESVEDGWILVKTKTTSDVINIDYIIRIREYPRNKNGKKKSIVLD